MSKQGYFKYEITDVEFITIKTVNRPKNRNSTPYVYVPKEYVGRRAIIVIPAEKDRGGEQSE